MTDALTTALRTLGQTCGPRSPAGHLKHAREGVVDRGGIHIDAPFRQEITHIPTKQGKAAIPKNRTLDHVGRKPMMFEEVALHDGSPDQKHGLKIGMQDKLMQRIPSKSIVTLYYPSAASKSGVYRKFVRWPKFRNFATKPYPIGKADAADRFLKR